VVRWQRHLGALPIRKTELVGSPSVERPGMPLFISFEVPSVAVSVPCQVTSVSAEAVLGEKRS
jgi:hypothetical protein